MGMRAIDVLRNLDSHEDMWDITGYKLSKAEADVIVKALKLLIEKEDNIHADSEQEQQD